MNSRKGISAGKKRESRIGSRKVTSLTAEQLERKRANDREAQRTIRQRTKEHIEHLERRVAELSAKEEQFDNVLRRNTALETEIAHLRHQLAMSGSGTLYPAEGKYQRLIPLQHLHVFLSTSICSPDTCGLQHS